MKKEVNVIDYGIYIDHNHSYIIAINNSGNELSTIDEIKEIKSSNTNDNKTQSSHAQNHNNEMEKKFCKLIMESIINAKNILIFGPSEAKFELQKEIVQSKQLKDIKEELAVTDKMQSDEALRYTKHYYTPNNKNN